METLESLGTKLQDLRTGSTSLFDVVVQMNESSQLESGLDMRTWLLVRLAALAASDAPAESYLALVAVAEGEGVTAADAAGVLVAIAPAIGSPRALGAAMRLVDALATAG